MAQKKTMKTEDVITIAVWTGLILFFIHHPKLALAIVVIIGLIVWHNKSQASANEQAKPASEIIQVVDESPASSIPVMGN